MSNAITVHPLQAGFLPGPSIPSPPYAALLPLRKADIFVTASDTSPQYKLYGPNYTHTALYLGGDPNGTPLIAEAVTATEAASLNGLNNGPPSPVGVNSLDESLMWTQSNRVSAWRPTPTLALSGATRSAIVTWAQNITNQGLPYWSNADFGLLLAADLLNLALLPQRLNQFLDEIYTLTTSTNT